MGMTIAEKILAAHAGCCRARAAHKRKVDIALANDVTAPVAIREFEKIGADKVFDKDRWCWCRITSPPTKT